MKFKEMNLSKGTLKALEEMKLDETFPIQELTIKPIMEGKDLIGKAESGSGKTLAFAIPIVEKIKYPKNIQALIITPTRELAEQVCREFEKLGKYMMTRSVAVYGGKSMEMQTRAFDHVNVVVATPGRLMDHMRRNNIDLSHVHTLVLDEADRMLDMGFIDDIRFILRYVPKERQTLLFSATFSDEIRKIVNNFMNEPILVELNKEKPAVRTVRQTMFLVNEKEKIECLEYVFEHEKPGLSLIFVSTKYKSNRLHRELSRFYNIGLMHGDLSQHQRERVLADFKSRRIPYLIATDVAARGIDVKDITHVVNYDLPNDVETYVHRIGRTGRAGTSGDSITFITPDEIQDFLRIEHFVKVKIEKHKFVDGQVMNVNPEEFSERNVIIKKWDRREGGGFRRGGRGFGQVSSHESFRRGGGFGRRPSRGFGQRSSRDSSRGGGRSERPRRRGPRRY